MNRFFGGLLLVGVGCAVTLGACAPSSSEVGKMKDPDGGVGDGGEPSDHPPPSGSGTGGGGNAGLCKPGQVKQADDGCNTCSCDDSGQWGCTEIGCVCKPGEVRLGDDGCSKCACEGGSWACDPSGCADCSVGDLSANGCCVCADHGAGPTWDCDTGKCAECSPGETRVSDDKCSTCTCGTDGSWQCPPAGTGCGTCVEGSTKPAGDDCNSCTCFHGSWACTLIACPDPMACEPGVGDCDGDPSNGCESKLTVDLMNCGRCGNICDFVGGIGTCQDGECSLTACTSGWADCDLDPRNGCEVPVGPQGCSLRCEYPEDGPGLVAATGDCKCPTGTTCVKNTYPDKPDYCYPKPNGCGDRAADCACLGACACASNAGATCSEQMASGGFILDCDGLK